MNLSNSIYEYPGIYNILDCISVYVTSRRNRILKLNLYMVLILATHLFSFKIYYIIIIIIIYYRLRFRLNLKINIIIKIISIANSTTMKLSLILWAGSVPVYSAYINIYNIMI